MATKRKLQEYLEKEKIKTKLSKKIKKQDESLKSKKQTPEQWWKSRKVDDMKKIFDFVVEEAIKMNLTDITNRARMFMGTKKTDYLEEIKTMLALSRAFSGNLNQLMLKYLETNSDAKHSFVNFGEEKWKKNGQQSKILI